MATKPIKFLELHYTMTQFLIINYTHDVLLSERNTCLRTFIIRRPKTQRNVTKTQPSTHLNIAQKYFMFLKTEE